MSPDPSIRPEEPRDHIAIGQVIDAAFRDMPFAAGDEAELVVVLRKAGALAVSLVAELNGTVIGHVAFSPARPADGSQHWYALGPVAVLPTHQRHGIGSQLVREGLRAISALGAMGCILTGNPSYYSRFGFEPSPGNTPPGEPAEYFMVKALGTQVPKGPIYFHEAFGSAA
jgi:putative acetyltransferase